MKKQHQIWLKDFLKNCENSNKSRHTLINYRADLIKFIRWHERHFPKPLNQANAQTIGLYKEYLTSGTQNSPKKGAYRTMASTVKNWFKKIIPRSKFSATPITALPTPLSLSSTTSSKAFLAVSSRRRHLSAIRNFYEYLKQANEDVNDLFQANPVKPKLHGIKLKEQDVENTKLLKDEDWKRITNTVLRPREKLVVNLLYYGGLRLSELSDLKVSQFDASDYSIKFVRKGGYVHHLNLQQGEKIFSLLQTYLGQRTNAGDFLFYNKKGNCLSSRSMYTIIMKVFLKANCPTIGLTPHSFRKACATNLYKKTKDLLFVRDYLNHSDAKVTQTYIEKKDLHEETKKYLE